MQSHPRISELLIENGAYDDLDKPVILTSGELGVYYIHTERLCQDGGEWERNGELGKNSPAMIAHAVRMMNEHPTFEEVIDILSEETRRILHRCNAPMAVSGGQRRDWIFSGPVAHKANLPHISLYKQKDGKPDKVEWVKPDGSSGDYSLERFDSLKIPIRIVHLADLLTEGSSYYHISRTGKKKGCIPMLRERGADVRDLIAVVTRLQGGEDMLEGQRVKVHSPVAIDEDFLRKYSKNPERNIAYLKNPEAWSEDYLFRFGALALVENFDPKGRKLDSAKKFLERYGYVLRQAGKFMELELAVHHRYGIEVMDLFRGK